MTVKDASKPGNAHVSLILGLVRITISVVKKSITSYILCVCILSYPARKAHAAYYIDCGLSGSTIIPQVIS
jgi:hypothetical protein